ncbi:MAG: polysaccharide deacetylase family protein, partial [Butyricicoccaceae bacterium]
MIVFQTISAKRLGICAGILCATLVVGSALLQPMRAVLTAATKRDLPIYCVDSEEKVCSLTFDAAWGNEDTGQLIEILGEHNIQATFFVV